MLEISDEILFKVVNVTFLRIGIFLIELFIFLLPVGAETKTASQKIAVIGTGYVGLVLGTGLAEWGHQVTCVDILEEKIASLQKGVLPFYEPGMESWVKSNVEAGRLTFSSNTKEAIRNNNLIFICLPTPPKVDGSADISAVESVALQIAENLNSDKIVCIKSTIPIGTSRKIQNLINDKASGQNKFKCEVAFNPEFLREGSAISDFLKSDRVVVGGSSEPAMHLISQIFSHSIYPDGKLIATDFETAESIKYASNAFLATKISFINEFANLCEATGADIEMVAFGLGLDKRIGQSFLKPGPGYGGSCFPKDTLALIHQSKNLGVDLKVVQATIEANEAQKCRVIAKLKAIFNDSLEGRKVAILGLAFKPNTDDIRFSPAITIIEHLLSEKAHISAYDPMANENMKRMFPRIEYATSIINATHKADAVIMVTDWDEIKYLDLSNLRTNMRTPVILDTRNLYDPHKLGEMGFIFSNTGRLKWTEVDSSGRSGLKWTGIAP